MVQQNVPLLSENIHSDCTSAKGLDHGFGLAPIFIEKKRSVQNSNNKIVVPFQDLEVEQSPMLVCSRRVIVTLVGNRLRINKSTHQ
jgi:hypothetical protein